MYDSERIYLGSRGFLQESDPRFFKLLVVNRETVPLLIGYPLICFIFCHRPQLNIGIDVLLPLIKQLPRGLHEEEMVEL